MRDEDKTDDFIHQFESLKKFDSNMDKSYTLEANILDFLRFYEKNKTCIDIVKSYPILMEDLPDICYQRNIEDDEVLIEIFKTINALKPTALPHLILFFLYQTCSYKTNSPEVMKKRNEDKRLVFSSSLAYFLYHVARRGITLNDKHLLEVIPELDTKLYSKYLFFSEPRCVLYLIRCGLRFSSNSVLLPFHPIFQGVAKQLLWYIKPPSTNHEDPSEEVLLKYYLQGFLRFRRNLEHLLQATKNPQEILFELPSIMATYSPDTSIEYIRNRLKYMFPELNFELKAPASLQHLSRWEIRELLLHYWDLPCRIMKLPLSRPLQRFTNFSH